MKKEIWEGLKEFLVPIIVIIILTIVVLGGLTLFTGSPSYEKWHDPSLYPYVESLDEQN